MKNFHTGGVNENNYQLKYPIKKVYGPDMIGIAVYHDQVKLLTKPVNLFSAILQQATQNLNKEVGGTGTNGTAGLRTAIDVLTKINPGIMRNIDLLTDGQFNRDIDGLIPEIARAYRSYININTIGFGDPNNYNEKILRQIAKATHRGKFIPVDDLRKLTDALIKSGNDNGGNGHRHRAQATMLVIDVSPSMNERMGDNRKIEVVKEAVMRLMMHKQRLFA